MTATVDAPPTQPIPPVPSPPSRGLRLFELDPIGLIVRLVIVLGIAGLILAYVLFTKPFRSDDLAAGVIVGIGALSLNVLVGYAGQISLGHQAFIGIGAFISAYVISEAHMSFYVGVAAAV